jgi:dTDP-4-dehydrorhamnose 3,5-epimerase
VKFVPTAIPEVIVVQPDVHRDGRGFFFEVYHAAKFRDGGIDVAFVQDNHSRSTRGTLRGLHAQRLHPQAKLVRVLDGEVFDVAVDVRRGSPTFLRWVGVTLTAENRHQLYVPVGFVHGFCVLSDTAEVEYKCSALYDPADEIGVTWDDPDLGVTWPTSAPVLSKKDAALPRLREIEDRLPVWEGSAAEGRSNP